MTTVRCLYVFYPIFYCSLYCRSVYNAEQLIFHDSFLFFPNNLYEDAIQVAKRICDFFVVHKVQRADVTCQVISVDPLPPHLVHVVIE